jgi:hypothetical protein
MYVRLCGSIPVHPGTPDGCHFSGSFTLDAYDTSGKIFQSFTGVITGTRITTHTTVGDLL